MRLIGMLDSPYVRRVAICLEYLGVPFQHEALSVFRNFDEFAHINPVVKAPTLVLHNGTVLMDSPLILQFIEATAASGHDLWSRDAQEKAREMRAVGLAMAGCEKSAQFLYECNLRPKERQHEPWLTRVAGQLQAAYRDLEAEVEAQPLLFQRERGHGSIAAAVAWQFTQSMLPQLAATEAHPQLTALSERMEQTAQFRKYPPDGPGVPTP
jgi:glutathione S-transferase